MPGTAEALRKHWLLLSSPTWPSQASHWAKLVQVPRGKKEEVLLSEIMNLGCFMGWEGPHRYERSLGYF